MVHAFRYCIFLSLFMFAMSSNAKICRPLPRGNTDAISGLIYCINQANSSLEDDIIDLGGAIYTLDGTNLFFDTNGGINGLPKITANSGKLSIITGAIERSALITTPLFRFFYIEPGAHLYLYNVTLENGSAFLIGAESQQQNGAEQEGLLATGQDGGALYNLGILNLRNTFLLNNYADGIGGAIYNNGTIAEIYNSIFSGNQSNAFSIFNGGGAIFNDIGGTINGIDDTTISNNRANNGSGGGIYNNGIIESIKTSAIDNNFAYQNGGGVYNHTQVVKANLDITAEIYSISNNTLYGNIAANGAGIFNEGIIDEINNNTISGNGSVGTAFGGGIYNEIDALIYNFVSNIVASNTAFVNGQDLYNVGNMVNQTYNLLSNNSGNGIVNGVGYNIVTATPFLGVFQDNGGPTFTIALLPGSLAINHGANPDGLSYDQRGSPYYRTVCGMPDIGAYERPGCHN